MPFKFIKTHIPEVTIIKPEVFRDNRGMFMESYRKSDFERAGIDVNFVQDNCSESLRGVLRGLHYQLEPKAQGKLVTCIKGRVFDVAVDLRRGSPTFKKWVGVKLSEENRLILWIPEGFAHGFLSLSDSIIIYKVSGSEYSPEHERSIRWDDPDIGIEWPLEGEPILSGKDEMAPLLKDAEINFVY